MSLLENRISKAKEYLNVLEFALGVDWHAFFKEATAQSNWLYRLAAIHPKHYSEVTGLTGTACRIRGPRSMPVDMGVQAAGCNCHVVWDYACHLEQPKLVADHLFPFSFGGPSFGTNKIFLCSLHNQAKGSDIHLFPWERGEPEWLPVLLNRVEEFLGRQRA